MTNKTENLLIVFACFMIQAVGVGVMVTYGVFFTFLADDLGWSRASISGASSLAFFLSGAGAIIIGRLNDCYGPQNLMRLCAILMGAGLMLMSQVSELWQLYAFYGLLFGTGLGSVDVIALTTTARWFTSSRGMMTGFVKVGTGAGQFFIPALASILIVVYGWRSAYFYIGIVAMLSLLCVAQVLKRDRAHQTLVEHSAEKSGSNRVDGDCLGVREAFRTRQFWTICFAYGLIVFCLLVILVHIVPHATDLGLTAPVAAGVLSTIGAVSIIGRLAAGFTIDRSGSKRIIVTSCLVLIAGLLWLQIADTCWMLYLFACIYGLAHGGFFTGISTLVAEIFGIKSHGGIFGIVVFFGTTGGSIGPILAGHLFDMTNSYTMAFRIIVVISMVGFALILSLKPIEEISQKTPIVVTQ